MNKLLFALYHITIVGMSILIAYLAFRVKGESNSIEPMYCHYKEVAPRKREQEEIEKYFNL